ncbi:MAG: hypothetical protein KJI69_05420 [Patescibacteria group bacterium]|nr:hypothetical protein [Patescibacteria group bacterium]
MAKKKKVSSTRIAMFLVGLVIGLGLIIFDQFETIEGIISGTEPSGLGILDVPIDPTTGGILGTIVLGAPDEVPFEQAGTIFGIPSTRDIFPRSPCSDNFLGEDGISIVKSSEPLLRDSNGRVFLMPPDFERRLSGERNQLDPVWWGSLRSSTISSSFSCAFAYAQWDIVDIPNDFVATSVVLKLQVLETRSPRNPTFQVAPQGCDITLQDFNLDTIADEGFMNKIFNKRSRFSTNVSIPPSDALLIKTGGWCNSLGVKSFQLGQSAVDLINDAISGGAFSQGVRSDKLLLGFTPTHLNNEGSGKNRISTEFWKTQGSLFLTGSSPPIRCSVGFNQVDFRCIPIVCDEGMKVNATTNECEQIRCAGDEELLGNICTPIICNIGEQVIGGACIPIQCGSSDQLVGSECVPLICDVGFEAKQNECVLKTCGIGLELNQDTCQAIVCPSDFILVGSDCMPKQCPSGQLSFNNECRLIQEICDTDAIPCEGDGIEILPILECPSGFNQVGASCILAPENCPEGTVPQQNVCVQFLPDLMISQAPELGFVTILGIVIFGGSMFGLVGATRRV